VIELGGFVPREHLPEELSRAHVFAAPSVYEGGPGFVYLEAMACGLPVIACEGSGAAEVVRHGETGLLVPPRDTAALAAGLRGLLGEPTRLAGMGVRALEYVRREANAGHCVRQIQAFYTAVLTRRQPGMTP